MNEPIYSTPSGDAPTPADVSSRKKKIASRTLSNRRSHERHKRRVRELRAENELLHRRLAAIYDALNL